MQTAEQALMELRQAHLDLRTLSTRVGSVGVVESPSTDESKPVCSPVPGRNKMRHAGF